MSLAVFFTGDTVQLRCTFRDWGGKITEPSLVKVKIYNSKFEKIDEIENPERESLGTYKANYTVPNTLGAKYVYEWYAEIDGTPSIVRDEIIGVFKGEKS